MTYHSPTKSTDQPRFASSASSTTRRRGPAFVVLVVALAVGVLESTQAWIVNQARGTPQTVARALGVNMPWWLLWGLLAVGIIALARRYPLGRPLVRRVPIHVAASIVFSVVHLAGASIAILLAPDPPGGGPTLANQFRLMATAYFFMELVTYWAILGGYSAWEASLRNRRTEEERRRLAVAAAEAETDRARLERQMVEARLHALRTELNPHFLFNSLNGVSALARNGDVDGAVTMLARIGELLRRTLESDMEETCTVADELDLVRLYLAIERVRYGSRLDIVEDVSAECAGLLVPPLLLQPLVENAIRHGVAAVDRTVHVVIEGLVDGESLILRIADSGPGPSSQALRSPTGVGLRNVRERLATLHGAEGELRLDSRPGGGTVASVRLPAERVLPVRA